MIEPQRRVINVRRLIAPTLIDHRNMQGSKASLSSAAKAAPSTTHSTSHIHEAAVAQCSLLLLDEGYKNIAAVSRKLTILAASRQRFVQVFAALRIGDEGAAGSPEAASQLLGQAPSRLIAIGRQDEPLHLFKPRPVVEDVAIFLVVLRGDVVGALRHGDEVALFVPGRWSAVRHRHRERETGLDRGKR